MIACFRAMQEDRIRCKALDRSHADPLSRRQADGVHSFSKLCDLALMLLRHEIERLLAWYHTGATQV